MSQLSKEEIKTTLQAWTKNNFSRHTKKIIEYYISKNIYAFNKRCLYVYVKKETSDDLEFNLVIFPFKIEVLGRIIEEIDGVELGKVELHSNFNAFKGIVKDEDNNELERTGYSVEVYTKPGLVKLLEKLDEEVYSGNLKEIEQRNLTKKENLQELYRKIILKND